MDVEISLYCKYLKKYDTDGLIFFFGKEILSHDDIRSVIKNKSAVPFIEIVSNEEGKPESIILHRPLISTEDIYYTIASNKLVISNMFKHVLVAIDKEARTISKDAIVDHFLFRAVPGENTYCENIHRVGHGSEVTVNLANGNIQKKQICLFSKSEKKADLSDYVERTNDALINSTNIINRQNNPCLFYSGGVDSTLLATYLPDLPLVNNQITSEEFVPEIRYSEEGAEVLGRTLDSTVMNENVYFSALEETIDGIGMPPHHAQTVLLHNGMKNTPYNTYVVGQSADALYGLLLPRMVKYRPFFKHKVLRAITKLALPFIKGKRKFEVRELITQYEALSHPINSVDGYAMNFAKPAKTEIIEQIFGSDIVEKRIKKRYDYLLNLGLNESHSRGFHDHIEVAHLIDFFGEDTGTVWCQTAKSLDKEMYLPFATQRMVDTAYTIPKTVRYFRENDVKYILKELLYRKLKNYPKNRAKLGGVLPLKRYFLTDLFEEAMKRYDFPEFLTDRALKDGGQKCQYFLWHAITFIIWENRFMRSDSPSAIEIQPDEQWTYSPEGSIQAKRVV